MLSDITIGQFFPGESLLHRMDPRVKLALTFLYIIVLFVPQNWVGLGLAVGFLALCVLISRIPIKVILKGFKPIIPILIFTSLINLFYAEGTVLLEFWILTITLEGIYKAVFIALRILCLIAASSLLTYTTSPTTLTDALERLMSPLRFIRVPVHEIAMMMTIALRFIPSLIEETDKIMSAQKARGADMESGNILQRVKALIPVLVPLFVSSFRRAFDLATAMECRCYHGGDGRTRMKQLHMAARDFAAVGVVALLIAGLIVSNSYIPAVI